MTDAPKELRLQYMGDGHWQQGGPPLVGFHGIVDYGRADIHAAELAEAVAENERWRAAKGPFDDALCDLSSRLIMAEQWPANVSDDQQEGTEADYRACCANVVAGVDLALSTIATLRAEVARLTGERWQPIETAPKDATWFLATGTTWNGDCAVVGWHFGGWRENPDPNDGTMTATHWMPLPAPVPL